MFWLTFALIVAHSTAKEADISKLLPGGYNGQMRPLNPVKASDALDVSVSMHLTEIIDIDAPKHTLQLDLILVQEWQDSRVNTSHFRASQRFVTTDSSIIRQFWLPETYIINGKSATVVEAMEKVHKLTITDDGLLSYAQRINAELDCQMNLQNFPHDIQYCPIKVSTLIYDQSQIHLNWNRLRVTTKEYATFSISYSYTADCTALDNPIPANACISGNLKLVRRLSYYIIRYYLTSFLVVAFSIVNFWFPIREYEARTILLVESLLHLILEDIAMNNEIDVYYVTSLHWWMMWLQGIIYLELVTYMLAISWAHFIADKQYYAKLREQTSDSNLYLKGYYFGNKGWFAKCGVFFDRFNCFFFGPVDYYLNAYERNKVDYAARVIFAAGYILFVFLYVAITTFYYSANFN